MYHQRVFFLPHLFRGGWRLDLPLRKISCMLKSQMQQWKETNEPYGWTQGLPGMESPKLRQFPLCSHIPASFLVCRSCLGINPRTGGSCVLMSPCSPQKENWNTRAHWSCCCSSSRLLGWGGLLLSLKTEWISPSLSPPWDESGRERCRAPAGRVTTRSCASHRHRGWVKILIYFNAAIEAF